MSTAFWLDPSASAENLKTDIAIVGGGMAGVSAAYWLRKSRYGVCLLERGALASGASGRSEGMLTLGLSEHYGRVADMLGREEARLIWSGIRENHALLRREIFADGEAAARCRYRQTGSFLAAFSEKEFLDLRTSAALLREDGFAVELLEQADAAPALGSGAFHGALLQPEDAETDPAGLVREIARRSGARVLDHCEVMEFHARPDHVLLRTRKGSVRCEMLILAAGAWLPWLHDYFSGKVDAVRGQSLATGPLEDAILPERCLQADYGDVRMRPLPGGRVIVHGRRRSHRKAETGYVDRTTPKLQGDLEAFLRETYGVRELPVTHRWASLMGFSRDFLPFAGALPWSPRVMFAGGLSGQDLNLGFLLGKILSETVLHGTNPGIFSAERFAWQD